MKLSFIVIFFSIASGCATKSVYFNSQRENHINEKRYRISAPSLYSATKQDIEWIEQGATSKTEFSSLFTFVFPFLLADMPISIISDSLALFHPLTWKNQNRKDNELSSPGPYIVYINNAYNKKFNSDAEFRIFLADLQRNRAGAFRLTSELWWHDFKCESPCDHDKPRTYRRSVESANCTQEQTIKVEKEWYSETLYEAFLKNTCI